MELILIRHLTTAYNRDGLLQGQRDVDILPPEPGELAQIRANQAQLANLAPFDGVFCSCLRRTRATAQLYGYETDLVSDPLLNELDFGPFEGQPREHLLAAVGDTWLNNPAALVLGESLPQLEARIRRFLANHAGARRLLVFGHGSWTRALLSLADRGTLQRMNQVKVPNNRLLRIELPTGRLPGPS
jgi:alpha-ribazole phosphatase